MADLHDAPSDGERNELEARVRAAADAGRISGADRDIRLGNVKSAQSRAELDLMRRDLDQLDASATTTATTATGTTGTTRMPPTPAPTGTTAPAPPYDTFDPGDDGEGPATGGTASTRTFLVIAAVAVVVVLGLVVALVLHSHRDKSPATTLPPAQSPSAGPGTSASPGASPTPKSGSGGGQLLSASGIRGFLATYKQQFGTTKVVDLVIYQSYVVVDVPFGGGRGRQQGWLYRPGSGWTSAGQIRAVFPGARPVDTRRLDVEALERNIRRATATLKVKKPTTTYVILRFIRRIDRVPSVDIHVANDFSESGYLATTLSGQVQHAYPFGE